MDETAPFRPLVLHATGITKHFGDLVALDGVDLTIPRHAIVSLIGPNGAGKTVFFNILTGFSRPDGGVIRFDGQPIQGRSPDQITALGIARTFQNIRLFGSMTALENVRVGQHARMQTGIMDALLHTLRQRAEELARNLPYGDQRRLEIVRALASEPTLLLLDEPTAGMNPQETAAIMALLDRLRRDWGLTILLIEHDMKLVMRISERISVLDHGVKIAEGTPEQVRTDLRVVKAYLGGITPTPTH
jgi:branched-chain amino acid transport system ATP-binding protein